MFLVLFLSFLFCISRLGVFGMMIIGVSAIVSLEVLIDTPKMGIVNSLLLCFLAFMWGVSAGGAFFSGQFEFYDIYYVLPFFIVCCFFVYDA